MGRFCLAHKNVKPPSKWTLEMGKVILYTIPYIQCNLGDKGMDIGLLSMF
jgi:hypothetical protein